MATRACLDNSAATSWPAHRESNLQEPCVHQFPSAALADHLAMEKLLPDSAAEHNTAFLHSKRCCWENVKETLLTKHSSRCKALVLNPEDIQTKLLLCLKIWMKSARIKPLPGLSGKSKRDRDDSWYSLRHYTANHSKVMKSQQGRGEIHFPNNFFWREMGAVV